MDYILNSSSFKEKPTRKVWKGRGEIVVLYPQWSNKNIEPFSVSAKYLVHVTISL